MNYKISFSTLFGYTDDHQEPFPTDAQAVAYATKQAKGRRVQVYNQAGQLIHDNQKATGEDR